MVLADALQTTATTIGIVGGLTGLLTGAWVTLIRPWLRRPKMQILAYEPDLGDCAALAEPGEPRTWVRLRVHNNQRSTTAEDTQVLIGWIRTTQATMTASRVGLAPLVLNNDRALAWSDRSPETIDIPPGVARRFDLLRLSESAPIAQLAFQDMPVEDTRQCLPSGSYEVVLMITVRSSPPVFQRVRFELRADWVPGERLPAERVSVAPRRERALPDRPAANM